MRIACNDENSQENKSISLGDVKRGRIGWVLSAANCDFTCLVAIDVNMLTFCGFSKAHDTAL